MASYTDAMNQFTQAATAFMDHVRLLTEARRLSDGDHRESRPFATVSSDLVDILASAKTSTRILADYAGRQASHR